jgi:catalase
LYRKFKPTLAGRKVGVLLGTGFDAKIKKDVVWQIEAEGAKAATVASKIQGEIDSSGQLAPADMALRASPSVLFDAVVILAGAARRQEAGERSQRFELFDGREATL